MRELLEVKLICSYRITFFCLIGTYRTPASYFSVRAGSQELERGGEVIKVAVVINHQNFNPYSFDYDFALLKLSNPINLDGKTKAIIPLPSSNQEIADNTATFVTGWGSTQNSKESNKLLRGVVVPTINQSKCNNIYYYDGGVTSRMVCAGSYGKDSCSVSTCSLLVFIYILIFHLIHREIQVR